MTELQPGQRLRLHLEGVLPPLVPWLYCRIGIPHEGMSYMDQDMVLTRAAGESWDGYGFDRGDMFIIAPDGLILVPSDRSKGCGITGWVPASGDLKGELDAVGWLEPPDVDNHCPLVPVCLAGFRLILYMYQY